MAKRQKKTIKDFSWKFGIKLAAVLTFIGAGGSYAANRYTIGLDTQENRCLDEWIFVIDTWRKPLAADVRRHDYVAVALNADQTPANALWQPGQVMVKRAVGTKPGDTVSISRDGITFSHGAEIWAHGTALEAAELLGASADDYEREIVLSEGELFMMGDHPNSYDGRYYGPVTEDQIVGSVVWAF